MNIKLLLSVIIIIVAIMGLGALLFMFGNTPPNDRPQVGEEIPIMGTEHIGVGQAHEPYNSNPPTSGPHYAQPGAWGFYDQPLPDEQLIHNLEHGGIWIAYKDVDAETIEKLRDIQRRNSGSVIVTPRPTNETKLSLASWGHLDKFEDFDEARILNFIRSNKNRSPEPIAR